MGEALYLVCENEDGKIVKCVSAHALGGGYKWGEFWNETSRDRLISYLSSTTEEGMEWSLASEYDVDDTISFVYNMGYTQEVRTFAVENGLTDWQSIHRWDQIIGDGHAQHRAGVPKGFNERFTNESKRE